MTPTMLLDLDGTLVDSAPDLLGSLNRVLYFVDKSFTINEITPMIGDGVEAFMERAASARGLKSEPDMVCAFIEDYQRRSSELTRPYPGVKEGLSILIEQGWCLIVCTNKPEAAARTLLSDLNLLDLFAAVGGGDSFPVKKPDPGHMISILYQVRGCRSVDNVVALGDHKNDILAAQGAGLPSIFAAWGYGSETMGYGSSSIARSFSEAIEIAPLLINKS